MTDGKWLRHSALVGRMAHTLDIDLGQAILDARLKGMSFDAMVDACQTCKGIGDCERWLDAHMSGAKDAPVYCCNRAVFASLRDSPQTSSDR
ncbi:DUF6455 family protein [Defluviimonas sp. WL0002]|uniref:DUF6455 family protein n=1 Tax=Albidovulum marisflavi TaxID=2984159 RepID=A0ABT2ZEN2_9RHOB|nr:DUF6455 family protein [Defluviimonas sp. WL0002]MCV2869589.1 DUF6455 family protein [Defluviimonas sp. WL0002]